MGNIDRIIWDMEEDCLSLTQLTCKRNQALEEKKKVDILNVAPDDLDLIIGFINKNVDINDKLDKIKESINFCDNQISLLVNKNNYTEAIGKDG